MARRRRTWVRYRSIWVRLLCCFAVAFGIVRAMHTAPWHAFEQLLITWVLGEPGAYLPVPPASVEAFIVAGLCLALALFRLDRPLAMVLCGALFLLAYFGTWVAVFQLSGLHLPLAAPLVGLMVSATALETMAWSEERSRRRELERLEAARQEFADMLVHDMKNRLSSMVLSLGMLEKEAPPGNERVREMRQVLRTSAKRLLLQASALLDIRRIEEGRITLRPRAVRLGRLLDEAIRELGWVRELVGVRLRRAGEAGVDVTARVDPDLCSRILANLLWNALQHAPAGSDVELELLAPADGRVGFAVANRGPMVPPEQRARLFEQFAPGDAGREDLQLGGTGLGLAFCKLAAEAHGGAIRLESPWPGHEDGVRIAVTFPAG